MFHSMSSSMELTNDKTNHSLTLVSIEHRYKSQCQIARDAKDTQYREECRRRILYPYGYNTIEFDVGEDCFGTIIAGFAGCMVRSIKVREYDLYHQINSHHHLRITPFFFFCISKMLRTQGGCFLLAALPMYILLYVYMYIPSLFVYSFTNSHRAKRADDEDSTKDWAPYLIPYVVCSIRSTKGKSHSHHTQNTHTHYADRTSYSDSYYL